MHCHRLKLLRDLKESSNYNIENSFVKACDYTRIGIYPSIYSNLFFKLNNKQKMYKTSYWWSVLQEIQRLHQYFLAVGGNIYDAVLLLPKLIPVNSQAKNGVINIYSDNFTFIRCLSASLQHFSKALQYETLVCHTWGVRMCLIPLVVWHGHGADSCVTAGVREQSFEVVHLPDGHHTAVAAC